MVLATDQLPGGTAQDYHDHITDSIDHLCYIYTELTGSDYQETRRIVIGNISNTMTDRAIVNYATIELLNEYWNITLNELNCHLHPLDTFASTCRSTLKCILTVYITTETSCMVLAIDQLPGGTAQDYHDHITDSIDHLCYIYTELTGSDYQETRRIVIGNISNTMTDRAIVNYATIELLNESWNITLNELNCSHYQETHQIVIGNIANTMTDRAIVNYATIELLNESWNTTLNELNCHLHPLDTFASTCHSTLKALETGKGDPRVFITFLKKEGFPRGFITRYRGNKLHVLFHLAGKYFAYYESFNKFICSGTLCLGGLLPSLREDYGTVVTKSQLHVLGLLGKLLTGQWMTKFYTSVDVQMTHVDGISIVKNVVDVLRNLSKKSIVNIKLFDRLLKKSRIICANPNLRPTQKPLSTSEREQLYMEIESLRRERNEARANILALEQLVHAKPLSLSYVKETMKIMYYRAFLSERLESDFRYWRSRNSKQRFSVNELLSQLFNSEEDDVEDDPDYEV
ncbi:hypothetical protein GQR58_001809 [Nymphon striatum]|nr:hypothetical protein GQR58_001809 [Nymphon striatum]